VLDVKVVVEFGEALVNELFAVVRDYGVGYPVSANDVSPKESLDLFGCNVCEWFSFNPLGEIIHRYQEKLDLPFSRGEGSYYVHSPFGKWPWCCNMMERFSV